MERRLISSRLSGFYKFAMPVLFLASITVFLRIPDDFPGSFGIILPAMFLLGFAFIIWLAVKVHKVEIDEDFFYISNFFREITVRRSELFEASEMQAINPYWIRLYFKNPTEFGQRIIFIPKWRLGAFWTANPLVQELNDSRTNWRDNQPDGRSISES